MEKNKNQKEDNQKFSSSTSPSSLSSSASEKDKERTGKTTTSLSDESRSDYRSGLTSGQSEKTGSGISSESLFGGSEQKGKTVSSSSSAPTDAESAAGNLSDQRRSQEYVDERNMPYMGGRENEWQQQEQRRYTGSQREYNDESGNRNYPEGRYSQGGSYANQQYGFPANQRGEEWRNEGRSQNEFYGQSPYSGRGQYNQPFGQEPYRQTQFEQGQGQFGQGMYGQGQYGYGQFGQGQYNQRQAGQYGQQFNQGQYPGYYGYGQGQFGQSYGRGQFGQGQYGGAYGFEESNPENINWYRGNENPYPSPYRNYDPSRYEDERRRFGGDMEGRESNRRSRGEYSRGFGGYGGNREYEQEDSRYRRENWRDRDRERERGMERGYDDESRNYNRTDDYRWQSSGNRGNRDTGRGRSEFSGNQRDRDYDNDYDRRR